MGNWAILGSTRRAEPVVAQEEVGMMQVDASPSVCVHFNDLVNPRMERTKLHPLLSVVAIALCGVIQWGRIHGWRWRLWRSAARLTGRVAGSVGWTCANRLGLAQVAVELGSNEIRAIPALLRLLVIKGYIVAIDAIFCQTAIAQSIRAQGTAYVLSLKAK